VADLRVFDYVGRSMERLGFLKRLLKRASATSTSNLENLGKDLISTVSQKHRVPITKARFEYVKSRVREDIFKSVKKEVDLWIKEGRNPPEVYIEIQDLYLADPSIPSQAGRLVVDNWRRYPALGTNLCLIRKGTYSLNTRGVSFLSFINPEELNAFTKYDPETNPLKINRQQGLLLLYSLIENDGEVIIPLWNNINKSLFTEKEAGDLLPNIYRKIISRHRTRLLPVDIRERLDVIEDTARSIEKVALSGKGYGGTSPRETAIRPRLEPYVDIGIFTKTNRIKYEYQVSSVGEVWLENLSGDRTSDDIGTFLQSQFFATSAAAQAITARTLTSSDEIVPYLRSAWNAISSSNGYAPIEEIALVAGVKALIEEQLIIEIEQARKALVAFQKDNPYQVRFTVDRLGVLAHAKFVEDSAPS